MFLRVRAVQGGFCVVLRLEPGVVVRQRIFWRNFDVQYKKSDGDISSGAFGG